ncbi:hypothetical protein [Oleiagrimonas sp.]|jgi:hypothetical protein|uniref:hypothetical protein n=1 Tax=Oleiagrimonas sp. TaxID=2010330 RepID=UPI002631C357|nr:hypothetical protein [Oleiagrimonas sp.]MDA3913137.1 hypothetical protein [Oleiagrimonas sp.]
MHKPLENLVIFLNREPVCVACQQPDIVRRMARFLVVVGSRRDTLIFRLKRV